MFNVGDRVRASKTIGAQCVLEGQTGTVTEVFTDEIGCYHESRRDIKDRGFLASEGLVQRTGFIGTVLFGKTEIAVKADEVERVSDESVPPHIICRW